MTAAHSRLIILVLPVAGLERLNTTRSIHRDALTGCVDMEVTGFIPGSPGARAIGKKPKQ